MLDIREITQRSEYDKILRDDKISDSLCFITFGGSHAYGTNIETSDVDIRGVCLNNKEDLIGLSRFNQRDSEETDTVIYAINRFVQLLLNCNPNCIELLGGKPESYIIYNEVGKELLSEEVRGWFLSKKAIYTFGGYATAQLRRLENALARDSYTQGEKNKHIKGTMDNMLNSFKERYSSFEEGEIEILLDGENPENDLKMNCVLKGYPIKDFLGIWSELKEVIKNYDKIGTRNNKKDELHLNKHMMHLCRLYLMVFDILEKGEVNTYREADHDFLMDVRMGKYRKDSGELSQEFKNILAEYEKRLEYDKIHTTLPDKPDYDKISKWLISVNKRIINGDIVRIE